MSKAARLGPSGERDTLRRAGAAPPSHQRDTGSFLFQVLSTRRLRSLFP
jgi:hypothetical protein